MLKSLEKTVEDKLEKIDWEEHYWKEWTIFKYELDAVLWNINCTMVLYFHNTLLCERDGDEWKGNKVKPEPYQYNNMIRNSERGTSIISGKHILENKSCNL